MDSNKSTFITSDGQSVLEAYKDLNKIIDDMDTKVEHVIKKHEAEFLYAYRNHIAKIKKQLAQIKHKSEEQERMFSSNDRIQYLQKEMIIFREEALKLYNKLDQKTQQNQYLNSKVRELEKQQQIVDSEEKEKLRIIKVEEMNKSNLQVKVGDLEDQLSAKDQQIAKLNKKIETIKEEHQRRSIVEKASLATSRRGSSLKEKVKKIEVYDSEMKEWFLDCIRTVKRQVMMRNINSTALDLSNISSIEEFKTVDKLRLLEVFVQNEKLLTWMYERIFPDRLSQMRYKLSNHQEEDKEKVRDEMNMSQFQKIYLPKVGRSVKSQLRNSGIVRNGKLNISQF